jgi:hypothetical protein
MSLPGAAIADSDGGWDERELVYRLQSATETNTAKHTRSSEQPRGPWSNRLPMNLIGRSTRIWLTEEILKLLSLLKLLPRQFLWSY